MYGRTSDPGMGPYLPRVELALCGSQVGVCTPCGSVSTRGNTVFVSDPSELQIYMEGFLIRDGIVSFPDAAGP